MNPKQCTNTETLQNFLEQNSSNWITVLIDFTDYTITMYGIGIGLLPFEHMGLDFQDWFATDLHIYSEMNGSALDDLQRRFTFWDAANLIEEE